MTKGYQVEKWNFKETEGLREKIISMIANSDEVMIAIDRERDQTIFVLSAAPYTEVEEKEAEVVAKELNRFYGLGINHGENENNNT